MAYKHSEQTAACFLLIAMSKGNFWGGTALVDDEYWVL